MSRFREGSASGALLFDELELTLNDGDRLGLMGPSGSGKSTLLEMLAGRQRPLTGAIDRAPGVRLAYLPQQHHHQQHHQQQHQAAAAGGTVWEVASRGLSDLRLVERRLAAVERDIAAGHERTERYQSLIAEFESLGGYGARAQVREVLAALGFPADTHDHPLDGLSSGQRQRLALASVLSSGAAVLLLDEPTNNLDLEARLWLEEHLRRRAGAQLLVSHDRELLAAVTTATITLESGRLRRRTGAYGGKRAWRRRRGRRRGEQRPPTASDPAAGTAGAGSAPRRVRGRLLTARALSLPGVYHDLEVRLTAGDRVALLGPNGSGKSSLLAQLAGELASNDPRAEIDYAPGLKLVAIPQDTRGLEPNVSLLEQARHRFGEGRAQQVLADADLRYETWGRPPHEVSGGERARAGLALALAGEFDLLMLDEPDNDLDLTALQTLETTLSARLAASSAALLLVTHDRRLALNLCERAWTLSPDGLQAYASVRALLRGEQPRPAAEFWQESAIAADSVALDPAASENLSPATLIEQLEEERSRLLTVLFDPLALSERDLERNQLRLATLEEQLMGLYDQRFEPAGPSHRFVERGLSLYAEQWSSGRWALLAAADASSARRLLSRPGAGDEPWLELHSAQRVAHLRVHEPPGSELLPWAATALLEAGSRLAFVMLGARQAQSFAPPSSAAERWLHDAGFRRAGGGWWTLPDELFLRREGWRVT